MITKEPGWKVAKARAGNAAAIGQGSNAAAMVTGEIRSNREPRLEAMILAQVYRIFLEAGERKRQEAGQKVEPSTGTTQQAEVE